MKKKQIELNALLWKIFNEPTLDELIPLPLNGRVSFVSKTKMPTSYWNSIGYLCINNFALRIDVFEKIFFLARQKIKNGPFLESADLMNPIGCNSAQLKDIMNFCGYQDMKLNNEKKLYYFKQKEKKIIKNKSRKNKLTNKKINSNINNKKSDPNSPFAVLEKLL